jgi:hypothetical protein
MSIPQRAANLRTGVNKEIVDVADIGGCSALAASLIHRRAGFSVPGKQKKES